MIHLPMHSDTSWVMFPGVTGCFGSRNIIHPHPGDTTGADQIPTFVWVAPLHSLLLFSHSHLEAFSAASVLRLMACLLWAPVMPRRWSTLQEGPAHKPSAANFKCRHHVFHPCLQHTSTRSAYLARFLSVAFSQGTVSSRMATCLDFVDRRTMSGLSVVGVMNPGNQSCLSRSTSSCQLLAVPRRPVAPLCCGLVLSLALMKGMICLPGLWCLYAGDGWDHCLVHLVMSPMIATIFKFFWAAAEDVLQGLCPTLRLINFAEPI